MQDVILHEPSFVALPQPSDRQKFDELVAEKDASRS